MCDAHQLPEETRELLAARLDKLLDSRVYPKTICPSEVARSLSSQQLSDAGVSTWRELMDAVRGLAWLERARGTLEVMQQGTRIADNTTLENIKGPIRLRRLPHTEEARKQVQPSQRHHQHQAYDRREL